MSTTQMMVVDPMSGSGLSRQRLSEDLATAVDQMSLRSGLSEHLIEEVWSFLPARDFVVCSTAQKNWRTGVLCAWPRICAQRFAGLEWILSPTLSTGSHVKPTHKALCTATANSEVSTKPSCPFCWGCPDNCPAELSCRA